MSLVYRHPISGETLLPVLQSLLPYTVPLYKRVQFQQKSPSTYFLATFPPLAKTSDPEVIPRCFAAAFVDRSRRPETECWIFLSGEISGRCSLSSDQASCLECKTALLSLIHSLSKLDVPDSMHDVQSMASSNLLLSHVLDSNVFLVGSLHEVCVKIIRDAGLLAAGHPGADIPYMKYIFQPDTLPDCSRFQLPATLYWGQVLPQDFDLVRKRTQIPRQNATLAVLPSLCIFSKLESSQEDTPVPIAWAFLGLDGSLTSLHTEAEYRGKGLAKMLAVKLFREGGYTEILSLEESRDHPMSQQDMFYHADVALENFSSRAVCEALGGTASWVDYWTRIDLTAARSLDLC